MSDDLGEMVYGVPDKGRLMYAIMNGDPSYPITFDPALLIANLITNMGFVYDPTRDKFNTRGV